MRKSSKIAVGLDIGHQCVKVVLASANGRALRVRRAERIPLPLAGADLVSTLRTWWAEEDLGKLPAVMGIGGGRVLYQFLEMEPNDPREPEQVARMEALKFGEMTDSHMEVSTTPASALPGERGLLLALAKPEQLEAALRPAIEAGVTLVNACPAPVALYNGVVGLGEPVHQPTVVADLGATHTEVVIGNGQGVRFSRSFAMGTLQLTQAMAGRQRIPLQQAERARVQAQTFDELPEGVRDSCAQFVRQWCQEINACVQMYREGGGRGQEHGKISRLLLGGGGSAWKPLREAIREACELSVGAVGRIPGHEQMESREFMLAAGLAAQGLGIARSPSSLLTPEVRNQLNRRRNKRYWMITGLFAAASVGMVAAATQVGFSRERKMLQAKNTTLQRSDRIRRESEELLARKGHIEKMMLPLADVVHNSARIRDLTLYLAEVKSDGDFLTFLGDSESYLRLRLDEAPEPEDDGRRVRSPREELRKREFAQRQAEAMRQANMNRLIIEGFTRRPDLGTVKDLVLHLRQHPAVERADLLSDDLVFSDPERDAQWSRNNAQRFVLEVLLVDNASRPDGEDAL